MEYALTIFRLIPVKHVYYRFGTAGDCERGERAAVGVIHTGGAGGGAQGGAGHLLSHHEPGHRVPHGAAHGGPLPHHRARHPVSQRRRIIYNHNTSSVLFATLPPPLLRLDLVL
eukprot:9359834-Pyramimonas_sp.AAC.1